MTPIALHLVVDDPHAAAAWYGHALDGVETSRLTLPDGRTRTVELRPGGTLLAVAGEMPQVGMRTPSALGGAPAAGHLSVPDVDTAFEHIVRAGVTVFEPVHDAFWADGTGQFLDPSGHRWALDEHVREVSRDGIARQAAHVLVSQVGS